MCDRGFLSMSMEVNNSEVRMTHGLKSVSLFVFYHVVRAISRLSKSCSIFLPPFRFFLFFCSFFLAFLFCSHLNRDFVHR